MMRAIASPKCATCGAAISRLRGLLLRKKTFTMTACEGFVQTIIRTRVQIVDSFLVSMYNLYA